MMETSTGTRDTRLSPPPAAARMDFYAGIHKALRLFMNDTLAALGRMDPEDAAEVGATLAQFGTLLDVLAAHVKHENTFVHPAIEARCPGGAAVTAEAHDDHVASIAQLRAEGLRLASLPAPLRAAAAHRLYQHLALFVAENLQHMHVEETVNNAALWALYTDAELGAIHDRLVASVAPDTMVEILRWMAPSFAPQELAGLLGGMRAGMPPEAFLGLVAVARSRVGAPRWAKVERLLG
jgi:Hemerythrin HHE cation binding domain